MDGEGKVKKGWYKKPNFKRNVILGTCLAVLIIFSFFAPLIIEHIIDYISIQTFSEIFNDQSGVSLSYYGAVLGGIVGGAFTYLGVKLSLDNQKDSANKESESHRKILLHQLKFSYKAIYAVHNTNAPARINLKCIIYDKEWYTHLPYIENLSQEELEILVGWFYVLLNFGNDSISDGVDSDAIKRFTGHYSEIYSIIEKLENN
jgi:hypothetical protein